MITLSAAYLAPIVHYALIAQHESYAIDAHEHFVKQSYRNRAEIYGANGKLNLIVPLQKRKNRIPMHAIEISYEEKWQRLHWRSFESAYRLSPYFEYYEDEFLPFYENKEHTKLLDFNLALEDKIKSLLGLNQARQLTEKYEEQEVDYRQLIHPKHELEQIEFPYYIQVFTEKYGFIPNLSVLDLLFNLGPASSDYLKELPLKF